MMGDVGGRLRVQSALNPILWLCAVVTVPAIGFASYAREPGWMVVCLVVIAFIPLVCAGAGFVLLLLRDPGKLQTEDYQPANSEGWLPRRSWDHITKKRYTPGATEEAKQDTL